MSVHLSLLMVTERRHETWLEATLGLTAQPTSTALSKWNACDLVTPLGSPKTSLFRAANVTGN